MWGVSASLAAPPTAANASAIDVLEGELVAYASGSSVVLTEVGHLCLCSYIFRVAEM